MGIAAATMLLIVGVAAAAGGLAPSEGVTTSSSLGESTDTTLEQTGTTVIVTDTTAVVFEDPTTTEFEDGDETDISAVHPDNFGGTISSLRHTGDHTPAAVIKGKTVPGWSKKHPEGTTTTTQAPATVPTP